MMLELSTIPPYANALWSISNPTTGDETSVYHSIREIIFDEMTHFGLVCNMLTSLGGEVKLTDPATVPKYPGKLPGGVRPSLDVYLSWLSRESAELFAKIEEPEDPLAYRGDGTSIGAFYDRISAVFPRFADKLTGDRQVTFPLGKRHGVGNDIIPMKSLTDALCLTMRTAPQSHCRRTRIQRRGPFRVGPRLPAHRLCSRTWLRIAVGGAAPPLREPPRKPPCLIRAHQPGQHRF
nr:ferritin-like protein [Streptomyces gilvosporeus]